MYRTCPESALAIIAVVVINFPLVFPRYGSYGLHIGDQLCVQCVSLFAVAGVYCAYL